MKIMYVEWKCSDCKENNVTEMENQSVVGAGLAFVAECESCHEEIEVDFEVKTKRYRI